MSSNSNIFFSPSTSWKTSSAAPESANSRRMSNEHNISIDSQTRLTTNPFISPFSADTPEGFSNLSKNRLSFGSALASPHAVVKDDSRFLTSSMHPSVVGWGKAPSPFPMTAASTRSSSVGRAVSTALDPVPLIQRPMVPTQDFSNATYTQRTLMEADLLKRSSSTTNVTSNKMMAIPAAPFPPKASMLDFSVSSKPIGTLPPSPVPYKAVTQIECTKALHTVTQTDYSTWVLVYGVPIQDSLYYQSIVSRFSSYGSIKSRYPTSYQESTNTETKNWNHPTLSSTKLFHSMMINWICLRYETPLEAEKALCQDKSFFSIRGSKMILGVMKMNAELALHLGLDADKMSCCAVPWKASASIKEEDILLLEPQAPLKRTNVCDKIMSWFLGGLLTQDGLERKIK